MQEYKRIDIAADEIVPLAQDMKSRGVTLVMIHGYVDKEGKNVISYDYAVGSAIESYTVTGESVLPSIGDIYNQAAMWPERELNELMPVEFTGLDTSQRLFLPEDLLDDRGQILVQTMDELKK